MVSGGVEMSINSKDLDPQKQIFVPYNGKIADITHADTEKHFLDLAAALSETRKIVSVLVALTRVAGTGNFYIYPNEGDAFIGLSIYRMSEDCVIADGTQRLQYALTVANDDFDLYCFSYVVEV